MNNYSSKQKENSQEICLKDKASVLGLVERVGNLIAISVPDIKIETLTKEVVKFVTDTTNVNTEWWEYINLIRIYDHCMDKHD